MVNLWTDLSIFIKLTAVGPLPSATKPKPKPVLAYICVQPSGAYTDLWDWWTMYSAISHIYTAVGYVAVAVR